MKKAIKLFLRFMILVGILLPVSGVGLPARAADDILQQGGGTYRFGVTLPERMCKGDRDPIIVAYAPNVADTPLEFVGSATGGTLSKSYWSFPAGTEAAILITNLTANKVGKGTVTLESMTDIVPLSIGFEVVDCDYELRLETSEEQKNDLVNFLMVVTGWARISSQDMTSTDGGYGLYFNGTIEDEDLKSGSKGLACALEESSGGSGTLDVTGSKNKDNITLSVQFKETEFGEGVMFHCLDENGRESIISMFENQSVNPGDSIPLSPHFSRGVSTYKFQFGESGSGTYTLIKRNKK